MRNITDHIVSGDQAHQLTITVLDEPGAGGANHLYEITGFAMSTNPSYEKCDEDKAANYDGPEDCAWVVFQNGPIKEAGINGITQEVLLAIVIDRLRSFQSGPFACEDNAEALGHCENALKVLQRRTLARIARGVEGTKSGMNSPIQKPPHVLLDMTLDRLPERPLLERRWSMSEVDVMQQYREWVPDDLRETGYDGDAAFGAPVVWRNPRPNQI